MRRYSTLSNGRQDTLADRVHRYRGVLFVILALVSLVLLLLPRSPAARKVGPLDGAAGPKKYAVIFDAGNSGSRFHVFCFDANLDLVHLGREINLFVKVLKALLAGLCSAMASNVTFQSRNVLSKKVMVKKEESLDNINLFSIITVMSFFLLAPVTLLTEGIKKKPRLSACAKGPREAAESLVFLIDEAKRVVPAELHDQTSVRVGDTVGLRNLGSEKSEQILQAVRDLLRKNTFFKTQSDWVAVPDGILEGAYKWVTINYLLGNLGKTYADTVLLLHYIFLALVISQRAKPLSAYHISLMNNLDTLPGGGFDFDGDFVNYISGH